jgi:hypothetical protein
MLNRNCSVFGFWGDGAVEAQLADWLGELSGLSMWRFDLKIVGAAILIERAVAQHVKDLGQNRGGDGTSFIHGGSGPPVMN